MPYTSHGHPYGLMDTDQPRPGAVARCGGPKVCSQCASQAVGAPELTDAHRHAERIILSHTEDIEFGTIGEMLADEYERLGQEEGDRLRDRVDKLISSATVTVSWAPDQAGDGR